MQPFDVASFLEGIDRHRAEEAARPDPQEAFVKDQFKSVVDSMAAASTAMLAFLKTYSPSVSVSNLPDSIKTPDVAEVTKAIKALEKALRPLQNDNSDVVAAIKSLEIAPVYKPEITVSPTPVTVKAPVITVEKPDLSPITKAIKENKPVPVDNKDVIKALKDVSQQIIKKPTPVANTPTDPLIYYLPADIDDAGAVQYFGYTDNKGAWYIRRFDTSAIPKTLRFAFGQSNYAANYTNRANLTYTMWGG